MNAIELVLVFVNMLCHAQPAAEMKIGQQYYLVQEWHCQPAPSEQPIMVKAYSRRCEGGIGDYYGHRFYVEFDHPYLKMAEYMNRFGGIDVGQGAQLEETYVPLCS